MKQLVSTRFVRALRKASQTGADIAAKVLEKDYDDFVLLVSSGNADMTDKSVFHNMLVYTRVELASLTEVSGKKCSSLSSKSRCVY
jgi:hypothetical protein